MTSNLLAALRSQKTKEKEAVQEESLPLVEAAKKGNLQQLTEILNADSKVKVDQKDTQGISALMHAAMRGHLDCVQLLINRGGRIVAKDDLGETAIMKVAKMGNEQVMEFLVEAQLEVRRKAGGASLNKAANQKDAERARILNAKDDEGVTALMKAAEAGELGIVEKICDWVSSAVEAKDDEGWNALMWACLAGQMEVVTWLFENTQLTADFATEAGETPL
mmetsp:Transcript_20910/g.53155  ORF Transcript_20910/g.53155 Transcript_20910/m.53155 type:complete len:221 (-) Transcript_20910:863-1525(-)